MLAATLYLMSGICQDDAFSLDVETFFNGIFFDPVVAAISLRLDRISRYDSMIPVSLYGRLFSVQNFFTSGLHFFRLLRGIVGNRWCSIW